MSGQFGRLKVVAFNHVSCTTKFMEMYLKQAKSEHRGTCIWTADPDHNKECQLIC